MQNKIITYFQRPIVQECVSVQAVEEQAGIPRKTLAHVIRGRRKLNEEHIAKLLPVLKAIRFVLIAALLICTLYATSKEDYSKFKQESKQ